MSKNPPIIGKPILKHSLNYNPSPEARYEANNGEIVTQPDLALTVSEILLRHSTGRDLPKVLDLHYTGDLNFPDLRSLDLVDRQNMLEWAQNEVKNNMDSLQKKQALRAAQIKSQREKVNRALQMLDNYEKKEERSDDK